MTDEEALIRAFIIPERREQYVRRLRPRGEAADRLHRKHFGRLRDLDPRFARRLDTEEQREPRQIYKLLREKGAADTCYLLGASDYDGQEVDLAEALNDVYGYGVGVFLSCIPGRLAYFEGEERGERYLLEKRGRWSRDASGISRLANEVPEEPRRDGAERETHHPPALDL